VQCDGKILLKEPNLLSLTKFKLLFQTEEISINSCDALKIVIPVRARGGRTIAITCPGAENLTTSLLPLHNIT
jgi:hypothetical protein